MGKQKKNENEKFSDEELNELNDTDDTDDTDDNIWRI